MQYHPAFLQFAPPPLCNKPLLHPLASLLDRKQNKTFLITCPASVIRSIVHPSFIASQEENNVGAPLICYFDYNCPTWSLNLIFRSARFPQHPLDTLAHDQFRQKPAVAGRLISMMAKSLRRVKTLRSCRRGRRSDRQ